MNANDIRVGSGDYLSPEEREDLLATKAYVAAMLTVKGPTDAQAERMERARLALAPLAGRPGLVVESAEVNALAKDLGQLAKRHGLRGCVLISFTDERVGVNSSGEPDRFGRAMEQLSYRLLAAIDDGKFDPTL